MNEHFGVELEEIFNSMGNRFRPEGAEGIDGSIGYKIKGAGSWILTIEDMRMNLSVCLRGETTKEAKDQESQSLSVDLSEAERKVYDHITDRPVHIDELTDCCDSAVPVMSILLQLELKHLVKQLPGKLFVR